MNMEISDVAINNPKGCIELLFMNNYAMLQ